MLEMPLSLKVENVIVFGSGRVAKRKIASLRPYCTHLKVISNGDRIEDVEFIEATLTHETISSFINEEADLVVSALNDRRLNRKIYEECSKKRILVNVVDDPEHSMVFFPAVAFEGTLSIAISTDGKCPFCAAKFREELEEYVKEKAPIVEILGEARERFKGSKDKDRMLEEIFHNSEFQDCVKKKEIEKARRLAEEIACSFSTSG